LNQATQKGIEAGKNELQEQMNALKGGQAEEIRQAEERAREATYEAGLRPISGGLDGFDNKVCELVKRAERSVRLCLATPLLHSLRKEAFRDGQWLTYDPTHLYNHQSVHWAKEFCEPFRHSLRQISEIQGRPKIQVELVFLDNRNLKAYVENIPDRNNLPIPVPEYERSVEHFTTSLRRDNTCDIFTYEVPDIPIYMAIIDGPEISPGSGLEAFPGNPHGVVAFMSASEAMRQRKEKRSVDQIAKNIQVYEFTNREVIRFFTHLFHEATLHSDKDLLEFLKHCRTHDWKWAVIAEGIVSEGDLTPYATLLHSKVSPHEPLQQNEEIQLAEHQSNLKMS
jgi:hypothetical protein